MNQKFISEILPYIAIIAIIFYFYLMISLSKRTHMPKRTHNRFYRMKDPDGINKLGENWF